MKAMPPPRSRSAAIRASSSSAASTTSASTTSLVVTGSAGDVEVDVDLRAHVLADVADDGQLPVGRVSRASAASSMSSGRIPRTTRRPS